jgi:hypothetical protein
MVDEILRYEHFKFVPVAVLNNLLIEAADDSFVHCRHNDP